MTALQYSSLSDNSRIGLSIHTGSLWTPGPSLPICINGTIGAKSKSLFKPKIPKSGKNLHRNFYLRSINGFIYIYHVETTLFVASLHKSHDETTQWIDDNYQTILDRVITVSR